MSSIRKFLSSFFISDSMSFSFHFTIGLRGFTFDSLFSI